MGTWYKPWKKYVFNHEFDDMDTILGGILISDHPKPMKRQLLKKIIEKGQEPQASNVVQSVLTISSKWFLNGETDLHKTAGWELFSTWAKNNAKSLNSFFTMEFLDLLLTCNCANKSNAPLLMHQCMRIISKNVTFENKIQDEAVNFVKNRYNTNCLRNFIMFLEEFKDCVPIGEFTLKFCECLIVTLSKGKLPDNQNEIVQYVKDVNRIIQFIHQIWHMSSDGILILECLKTVFSILSATNLEDPSNCLGFLITCVPNDVCSAVIKQAVHSELVDSDAMSTALQRMIDWLFWPDSINVDQIVIMFLKELAACKKYTVLITVTESKVEQVIEKLQYGSVRDASFRILNHMLLSFQHSAVPFHKIIPLVPKIIEILQKENNEESLTCLKKLVELLFCMMSLHTGFPDLYEPLIETLKMYPEPSEEMIQMKLAENKWGGQCNAMLTDLSTLQKSDTGKIGLLNLGNTCYMNSILQTLFMCDEFRHRVLTYQTSSQNSLLSKLQQVFAFLAKSQRPVIAPSSFLESSRPPWFANGCQQDCSEFLKYLLDQMDEQQKVKSNTSKSIIEDVFGGKLCCTLRCLKCKHESTRVENFIDIPLAFPHHNTSSKALAGGNAGDSFTMIEQEEKINTTTTESSSCNSLHLNDLIKHYLQTEKLTGDNKYHCDHCKGLQEGERNIRIEESPQYLVLTLLRFSYDVKLQCRSKIFREVKYPETLVLPVQNGKNSMEQNSKRMKPNNVPSEIYKTLMGTDISNLGRERDVYGLCSVIVHSGVSSECGHYYCYSRHSSPVGQPNVSDNVDKIDFLQDKWYLFNDCRVSYTSYDSFSNVTKRFNRDTAYVLVYRKISPVELEGNQSTMIIKEPTISAELRANIDKDNSIYLQEQEAASKNVNKKRERSSSTTSYYNYKDSDKDDDPPNNCGGGGLDDLDTTGARFIF